MSALYHSEQPASIPAVPGIYRITCTPTGKFYIGSAVNLRKRKREHLHALRHGIHPNQKMQRAYAKYGEDAFAFDALELVLIPELLTAREQYWFGKLNPFGQRGFNIDRVAGSRLGAKASPATREKLRLANLGKKHSEETKRKRAKAGTGRKHTEESKEKMRLASLGHPVSEEARERMRLAQLGKKQSEETKEKRRIALRGRTYSAESRAKISASNIAHPTHIKRMKTLIVTSPDGTVYIAHGIGEFCREHNLNRSALTQVAKGNANHHKGWTARFPDATDSLELHRPDM